MTFDYLKKYGKVVLLKKLYGAKLATMKPMNERKGYYKAYYKGIIVQKEVNVTVKPEKNQKIRKETMRRSSSVLIAIKQLNIKPFKENNN